MNKRHILFIVENNPAPPDKRVWNEALAAREFGYDVSIISPSDHPGERKRFLQNGIQIHRHLRPAEGSGKRSMILEYLNSVFWELFLSLRIFLTHPFDVIHAANPPDHIFLIALPFKLFGVKYLFDHHDITPENYVAKFGKKDLLFKLLLVMERLTFKTADLVISTNESYKKIALRRGAKRDKDVVVVRNGPVLTRLPEVSPNPKLREGFAYLVGYVGIIAQQEGIENLLRIASHVVNQKKRIDVKFIVVGKGPHLRRVIRQSEEMGLAEYVRFTGYIPEKDLHEILATADVCINPEFSNEFTDKSTMLKVMDYMMFGKPIVQFHTIEGEFSAGGAAVYIRENSVAKFGDALVDLLDNPDRRSEMGALGRKRIVEELAWDRQKKDLKFAYQRILNAG